jgi:hypothetical protein
VTEDYDRGPRVFTRVIVPPAPFMVVLDPKKSYNLASITTFQRQPPCNNSNFLEILLNGTRQDLYKGRDLQQTLRIGLIWRLCRKDSEPPTGRMRKGATKDTETHNYLYTCGSNMRWKGCFVVIILGQGKRHKIDTMYHYIPDA